jgi:hypothetical protein
MLSIVAKRYVMRTFDLTDDSAICENDEEVHCYVMTSLDSAPVEFFVGFEADLEAAAADLAADAGDADE